MDAADGCRDCNEACGTSGGGSNSGGSSSGSRPSGGFSSSGPIPDSICRPKYGCCRCEQFCDSFGECQLASCVSCDPPTAPSDSPSPSGGSSSPGGSGCSYDCDGWPYSQCEMSGRRGSATCINPFPSRGSNQKYSNCANVPSGCERCDDVCSKRDGKRNRLDY